MECKKSRDERCARGLFSSSNVTALLSDVSSGSGSCYESETAEEDADGLATSRATSLPPEPVSH